jgi:hypothetical protein
VDDPRRYIEQLKKGPSFGVLYVAHGRNAIREMEHSRATIPSDVGVHVHKQEKGTSESAHRAKTEAYQWSPFKYNLLLDADTRVHDWEKLQLGFAYLKSGADVAMTPSFPPQEGKILWSLSSADRDYTFQKLGRWPHIMLNTGVLFFHKNKRVEDLFVAWNEEWKRFKKFDQGAFLRALRRRPVIINLLGSAFNSKNGSIVEHRFGHAR